MAPSEDIDDLPFELTETDRINLAQGDEKFQSHTWDELKDIVGNVHCTCFTLGLSDKVAARNDLSTLKRKPSDLVRYIRWTRQTISTYGSMTDFVLKERLHWQPLPESTPETGPLFITDTDVPFGSSNDFAILYNDWPYGISPGITHLVVWLKTRIAVEGKEGYLTADSRQLIDDFVKSTFTNRIRGQGIPGDNVMWFKNWVGLQSVRGVEHIHVLVRNVPQPILDGWTARKR